MGDNDETMSVTDDNRAKGFNLPAILARMLLVTALLAAAGAWPTHALCGRAGLNAMLLAGAIVLVVACAAMYIVGAVGLRGGGRLAMAFVASGLGKVAVCAALGLAAAMLLPVPPVALVLWLVLFYVAMMVVQVLWIVKVLKSLSG